MGYIDPMTRRFTFYARLGLPLLWAATAVTLFGQQSGSVNGIEGIAAERRVSLLQRLEQLVTMYRARDWAGVYANLSNLPPIEETEDQFRERLVGAYPRDTGRNLVAFVLEGFVEQPSTNQWAVWECATLQGRGKRQTQEQWVLMATWERGRWFFSELLPVSQVGARKPMPCRTKIQRR